MLTVLKVLKVPGVRRSDFACGFFLFEKEFEYDEDYHDCRMIFWDVSLQQSTEQTFAVKMHVMAFLGSIGSFRDSLYLRPVFLVRPIKQLGYVFDWAFEYRHEAGLPA